MGTIGIVGLARDRRPAEVPENCDELWGFPDDEWWVHFARVYEIHKPETLEKNKGPVHAQMIARRLEDIAIDGALVVTQENYPLDEAIAIGGDEFRSSIDYMIAAAIILKPDMIRLFGVGAEGAHAYQRDGITYWLGVARGNGIPWDASGCGVMQHRPHKPEYTKRYGWVG